MKINGASCGYPVYAACQPKYPELFGNPVCNYRIDAGATDLRSQKVTIDWPEFRPSKPILSGPRIQQDATDLYISPLMPNFSFEMQSSYDDDEYLPVDCFQMAPGYADTISGLVSGLSNLGNSQMVSYSAMQGFLPKDSW